MLDRVDSPPTPTYHTHTLLSHLVLGVEQSAPTPRVAGAFDQDSAGREVGDRRVQPARRALFAPFAFHLAARRPGASDWARVIYHL